MTKELTIVAILESTLDLDNGISNGLALVKTDDGNRCVARYPITLTNPPKINEVWMGVKDDKGYHFFLTGKKEDIHPRVLTFLPYEPARKFEELKQFCLFYMQHKKSHAIFIKVSDSKALLLEDNHKNDGFMVAGEMIVIPYYLQPTSRVQKEAIEKVLDNYHMTE